MKVGRFVSISELQLFLNRLFPIDSENRFVNYSEKNFEIRNAKKLIGIRLLSIFDFLSFNITI